MSRNSKIEEIRLRAEADLETFIRLVSPKQCMGSVHSELCDWWQRQDAKRFQLTLLPRDHQKSRMVAFRVAHAITKDPTIRILYISSTSNLAEKQLKFIKDILTSAVYRRYWPEMVNEDEGKRERWTSTEISVDHPRRKEEGVRDPTIFTGGLTTNLVGMHCDISVMDDVVTYDNAYTGEGREKVKSQYSLLSSIEGTDAQEWVVGTRYHPKDLYSELLTMEEEIFNETGDIVDGIPLYEIFERAVEDQGDGTGQFLWPRQQRSDGKWFGFDRQVLAKKRAQYLDQTQFRAQYYNDPNDLADSPINRDTFQYYEPKHLTRSGSYWYIKDRRLNVCAAIDFAYSLGKRSDYTCLVVVGMDFEQNVYVLDCERMKTDRISEYYDLILRKHIKWGFRKLRAETTAAQEAIVKELKRSYLAPNGLAIFIEEHKPQRGDGNKAERIGMILGPRYDNGQIYHYHGGECQTLEDELVLKHPPHDDVKDALANAVEIAIPPMGQIARERSKTKGVIFNPKFGGVSI
jgi:hypothetical protein